MLYSLSEWPVYNRCNPPRGTHFEDAKTTLPDSGP